MSNLELVLKLAKEEIQNGLDLMNKSNQVEDYKEFLDTVYEGEGKQFKDDLDYLLGREHQLGFITDEMEIIEQNGEIISYRKWNKQLRNEVWGKLK
jgi:hypothetical protein